MLEIRRSNHNHRWRLVGCKAASEVKQTPYHGYPQMITTQRRWWMTTRRGIQFLKPHIIQRITAQPQPPVSGLQGKIYLSFDLQVSHVGRRTKEY